MVELIELKMDLVLGLLLKLRDVNGFFEDDLELVFPVKLKNRDSEVAWIQVNSKNSVLEEIPELLLFLNNCLVIADVDLVFLQAKCHWNLLLCHQKLKLLENVKSLVT